MIFCGLRHLFECHADSNKKLERTTAEELLSRFLKYGQTKVDICPFCDARTIFDHRKMIDQLTGVREKLTPTVTETYFELSKAENYQLICVRK